MNACLFDLEIQHSPDDLENGWNDKHLMGVSVCAVYDFRDRRLKLYWGPSREEMIELRERLAAADHLVSFNGISFDLPVLNGTLFGHGLAEVQARDHVDLLRLICDGIDAANAGRRQRIAKKGNKLAALLAANNLPGKTGDGADAPGLYQQGQLGRLFTYSGDDVRCTYALLRKWALSGWVALACGAELKLALPEPFRSDFLAWVAGVSPTAGVAQ